MSMRFGNLGIVRGMHKINHVVKVGGEGVGGMLLSEQRGKQHSW